jgi:hypothetical protein
MNTRIADTAFWFLCLGALLGNAAFFRARAGVYAAGDDGRLEEANGIIRALVVYVGALLLMVAAGAALGLTGRLLSMTASPRLTPFDILYVVAFVGVLSRATWWVYFSGGAELLAMHHAMFRFFPASRRGVMLLWAVAMVALGYGLLDRLGGAA